MGEFAIARTNGWARALSSAARKDGASLYMSPRSQFATEAEREALTGLGVRNVLVRFFNWLFGKADEDTAIEKLNILARVALLKAEASASQSDAGFDEIREANEAVSWLSSHVSKDFSNPFELRPAQGPSGESPVIDEHHAIETGLRNDHGLTLYGLRQVLRQVLDSANKRLGGEGSGLEALLDDLNRGAEEFAMAALSTRLFWHDSYESAVQLWRKDIGRSRNADPDVEGGGRLFSLEGKSLLADLTPKEHSALRGDPSVARSAAQDKILSTITKACNGNPKLAQAVLSLFSQHSGNMLISLVSFLVANVMPGSGQTMRMTVDVNRDRQSDSLSGRIQYRGCPSHYVGLGRDGDSACENTEGHTYVAEATVCIDSDGTIEVTGLTMSFDRQYIGRSRGEFGVADSALRSCLQP